jgi:hypothetical protein
MRYVDEWTNKNNKKYVERPIKVIELHVWGLRDGVKVTVDGYIKNSRRIKYFYTFTRDKKVIIKKSNLKKDASQIADVSFEKNGETTANNAPHSSKS